MREDGPLGEPHLEVNMAGSQDQEIELYIGVGMVISQGALYAVLRGSDFIQKFWEAESLQTLY